jgi:hypothetical protein
MAESNFSARKSHIYDLIGRLNAAFSRATRNLYELESIGFFDLEMTGRLYNGTKEAQANCNFHLLQALQELEQQDWARFGKAVGDRLG